MKISKSSWHYRLMDWLHIWPPYRRDSLCSYFQGLLFTLYFIISVITAPFTFIYFILTPKGEILTVLQLASILIGLLGWAIWLLLIYTLFGEGFAWGRSKLMKPISESHTTNILVEYLRARKQRVCPRIEFVDGGIRE